MNVQTFVSWGFLLGKNILVTLSSSSSYLLSLFPFCKISTKNCPQMPATFICKFFPVFTPVLTISTITTFQVTGSLPLTDSASVFSHHFLDLSATLGRVPTPLASVVILALRLLFLWLLPRCAIAGSCPFQFLKTSSEPCLDC